MLWGDTSRFRIKVLTYNKLSRFGFEPYPTVVYQILKIGNDRGRNVDTRENARHVVRLGMTLCCAAVTQIQHNPYQWGQDHRPVHLLRRLPLLPHSAATNPNRPPLSKTLQGTTPSANKQAVRIPRASPSRCLPVKKVRIDTRCGVIEHEDDELAQSDQINFRPF